MEDMVIKQNQNKQFKLVLLGLVMAAISVFVLIMGVNESDIRFTIIGGIGTMFFGACFAIIIRRFLKPTDILIVDRNGITDHSTATSVGFISWEDIKDIFITRCLSQRSISIKLKNTSKLLSHMTLTRSIYNRLNARVSSGAQISITLQSTDVDINEIVKMMLERLEAFRSTHS